jgi:hypothetical protein
MQNVKVSEALKIIDWEIEGTKLLSKINSIKSKEEGEKLINKFKQGIRKQRRLLSLIHHPDKGGDEEYFKKINNICDELLKIKLVQPQVIRHPTIIIRTHTTTYTNSTSTTTGWW